MSRWIAASIAALLLVAGIVVWRMGGGANAASPELPPPPVQAAAALTPDAPPMIAPSAPERAKPDRERARFARYDKDNDGRISLKDYMANRQRNFDKLDTDGDGTLSFAEYSAKAAEKFAEAGGGKGYLTPAEFAATAPKRRPAAECPPAAQAEAD